MPEFELNIPATSHPYDELNEFARGYIEAMFFTNGDTASDNESLLNDLGVEAMTPRAISRIRRRCGAFEAGAKDLLALAYQREDYDEAAAGRDFWFNSQGHGVGFWSRAELEADDLGEALSAAAEKYGSRMAETRGARLGGVATTARLAAEPPGRPNSSTTYPQVAGARFPAGASRPQATQGACAGRAGGIIGRTYVFY